MIRTQCSEKKYLLHSVSYCFWTHIVSYYIVYIYTLVTFSVTVGDSKFFSPDVSKLSGGIPNVQFFKGPGRFEAANTFHVDNAFYLQRRRISSTASSVVNVRCKTNGIFSFVRDKTTRYGHARHVSAFPRAVYTRVCDYIIMYTRRPSIVSSNYNRLGFV